MLDISYRIPPPPRVNVFTRHAIEVHILLSANGNARPSQSRLTARSGSVGALARSSFPETRAPLNKRKLLVINYRNRSAPGNARYAKGLSKIKVTPIDYQNVARFDVTLTYPLKDGVIGRLSLWIAEDFGRCASGSSRSVGNRG